MEEARPGEGVKAIEVRLELRMLGEGAHGVGPVHARMMTGCVRAVQ